jgi:hypothetical protein
LCFHGFFERGGIALFGLDFFVLFNQVKRTKENQSFRKKMNCGFRVQTAYAADL